MAHKFLPIDGLDVNIPEQVLFRYACLYATIALRFQVTIALNHAGVGASRITVHSTPHQPLEVAAQSRVRADLSAQHG